MELDRSPKLLLLSLTNAPKESGALSQNNLRNWLSQQTPCASLSKLMVRDCEKTLEGNKRNTASSEDAPGERLTQGLPRKVDKRKWGDYFYGLRCSTTQSNFILAGTNLFSI